MSGNGAMDIEDFLGEFSKTFRNLLKEFPKRATDDFIYDESTMTKIGKASEALAQLSALSGEKTAALQENERIKKCHKILSQLMDELPKDPADEFAYDRTIHQLVEDARQTLADLAIMST
jgi:hypothetical protein